MKNAFEKILISSKKLQNRIKQVAKQVSNDYKDKNPVLICVLKGAAMFFAELCKNVTIDVEFDFIQASSYGAGVQTSGEVSIVKDLSHSIKNRDVVLVEDIVDTGTTLLKVKDMLIKKGAKSVAICTMLNKPSRRKVDLLLNYVGFEVENQFVVGYGLDFNEKYRNVPYIAILKESEYK